MDRLMLRLMFFVIVLLATSNYPAEAQVFRRGRILSFSINRNQPAPQYCPSLQNTAQEHVRFSAKNLQNQYPSFAIQDSVPTTSEHPVHQFQTWPVEAANVPEAVRLYESPIQSGNIKTYSILNSTNTTLNNAIPNAPIGNGFLIQDPDVTSAFDINGQPVPVLQARVTTSEPVSIFSGSITGQIFTGPAGSNQIQAPSGSVVNSILQGVDDK